MSLTESRALWPFGDFDWLNGKAATQIKDWLIWGSNKRPLLP